MGMHMPWNQPIPAKGSFRWPGWERLSVRERVLLEARDFGEMLSGLGVASGNLESFFGYFEYLWADWATLHGAEAAFKSSYHLSHHNYSLRADPHYVQTIGWKGPIPRNHMVIEWLEPMLN